MRVKKLVGIFTALAIALLTAVISIPSAAASSADAQFANRLYVLINDYRAQHALAPLRWDAQLSANAQSWTQQSADLANVQGAGVFQHSPGSYAFPENIVWNMSADQAFSWWVNSPAHRANMLRAADTGIGVGAVQLTAGPNRGAYLATAQFGQSAVSPEEEAALEAARQEAARLEAARQEAARLETERVAAEAAKRAAAEEAAAKAAAEEAAAKAAAEKAAADAAAKAAAEKAAADAAEEAQREEAAAPAPDSTPAEQDKAAEEAAAKKAAEEAAAKKAAEDAAAKKAAEDAAAKEAAAQQAIDDAAAAKAAEEAAAAAELAAEQDAAELAAVQAETDAAELAAVQAETDAAEQAAAEEAAKAAAQQAAAEAAARDAAERKAQAAAALEQVTLGNEAPLTASTQGTATAAAAGSQLRISGLDAAAVYEVVLPSAGVNLGAMTADAAGSLAVAVPAVLTAGEHKVALFKDGTLSGWTTFTVEQAVTVLAAQPAPAAADGTTELAATGLNAAQLAIGGIGTLMALTGAAALAAVQRQRSTSAR
ncbi:hypothetical protein GCM10017708_29160 [Arthrobacter citreus]